MADCCIGLDLCLVCTKVSLRAAWAAPGLGRQRRVLGWGYVFGADRRIGVGVQGDVWMTGRAVVGWGDVEARIELSCEI